MLLIGSRALSLRAGNLLHRSPKDFDFVCTKEEFDSWMEKNSAKVNPTKVYSVDCHQIKEGKIIVEGDSICEFELILPGSSAEMMAEIVVKDSDTIETPFGLVPSLDMLFTIKKSHRFLKNSPHFWKTALDYHIMKQTGAKVRPEYQDFLKQREKETYYYKHPKLNQSKDNFFADDNIFYVWDHDSIHNSVALFDRPAYTYYMKDGAEVQCDMDKFFACSREIQLAGVIEEAAVLSIERSLVSHPGVWTPEYAWRFALMKVCSSITSGKFREFGYENIFEILKLYPKGYWEKFQEDCKSGKVKPFSVKKD